MVAFWRCLMFQSTHPHRVRRHVHESETSSSSFNPRTHIGCDLVESVRTTEQRSFNPRTHIGCDGRFVFGKFGQCLFQSTHPHRVRPQMANSYADVQKFQSTHPHRVRLEVSDRYARYAQCFNPRTHIGCDQNQFLKDEPDKFQSTHPHRVRPCGVESSTNKTLFQSTHPHRVRQHIQQTSEY